MNDMKISIVILFSILFLFCFSFLLSAQKTHSDNGDGTYTNPVIYSDFPDPDVIRVDSTYYMVSTTMFIFPGVTILKSYDLVNWEYCSNAVQRMDYSPCYNLDGCNRYSHGQWATSLKYHNGTYYLLFMTLDEGGFLCTAKKPEGPWKLKKLPRGFYDPGLFFDDDGKIYVAHGYSTIYITELDTNFVAKGDDVLVFTGDIRPGLEGSHVYKINSYYYLYCTYGGGDGFQVALRSTNIYGPYEEKIIIRDNGNLGTGLHQGALIETQTGEWWTIIFQDGGAFGRFPTLQPVTWIDDWPMAGVDGKGVVTYQKPNVGKEPTITILPTSDEFDSTKLGMQWGWNHNPDSTKWSLTENPGYLRLSTAKVVSNLPDARNTLTQRIFAYYSKSVATTATVKIIIDHMQDGDVAGLAVLQNPYAFIGIKKMNGINYVVMVNNGKAIDSTAVDTSTIYLKAHAKYGTSRASFAYSLDNQSFKKLGNELVMEFNLSIFTGNKFCLFNYATIATGGFVDFDWFRTGLPKPN
jgi:beta-xylosidase